MTIEDVDIITGADAEPHELAWPPVLAPNEMLCRTSSNAEVWPERWQRAANVAIESRTVGGGTISRLKCAKAGVAGMATDLPLQRAGHIFALHVLAGEIELEHDGLESIVRGGGVVAFDAAKRSRLKLDPRGRVDIAAVVIARKRGGAPLAKGRSLILTQRAGLLGGAMRAIVDNMAVPEDEIAVLLAACGKLLALTAETSQSAAKSGVAAESALLRAIIDYADAHLAAADLAPTGVAARFAISPRYLHKLFRGSGTTFGAYVRDRRLELIRSEIINAGEVRSPIAALARKWGFSDLSTFNRAFKSRFGCAPRRLVPVRGAGRLRDLQPHDRRNIDAQDTGKVLANQH